MPPSSSSTDLTVGEAARAVKFGLVPFSHHVHTILPGSYVLGQKPGATWTGCTQDRPYPANISVTSPSTNDDATKWGQPQDRAHQGWGCLSYVPNGLVVRPLSTDHAAVKQQHPRWNPINGPISHSALSLAGTFSPPTAPSPRACRKRQGHHKGPRPADRRRPDRARLSVRTAPAMLPMARAISKAFAATRRRRHHRGNGGL